VVEAGERSDFDFSMDEDRDFALQEYDPEVKFRRFQSMVAKRIDGYEKTVATLESCVSSFATSLKQVTSRCERLEREMERRVKAQDGVLKSQHLRIQELETWHQKQRRESAKRARDEATVAAGTEEVPLGPAQTLRRRESLASKSDTS
jgi:hypothetical protein